MLKRIGIGAALTIVSVLYILLINSIIHNISVLSKGAQYVTNFVIPMILFEDSYLMLNTDWIILCRSIRYGFAGLFVLIQKLFCIYVHTVISCSDIAAFLSQSLLC